MIRAILSFLSLLVLCLPLGAQEFRALARVDASASFVHDVRGGAELQLLLTQAVPYRIFTMDNPRRIVLDFREVAFDGLGNDFDTSDAITDVATGAGAAGWSRMVLGLADAMAVAEAGMVTNPSDGSARVTLRLAWTDATGFAQSVGTPAGAGLPQAVTTAAAQTRQRGEGRLVVVLDPGHGGVDPGAQRGGHDEADLMLVFAREFREVLLRSGRFDVTLTRDGDLFVPLPDRVSIARAAGADAFVSLHADALAEGRAIGATVYTLSDTASDEASAALAEHHDRADLLAGVDLSRSDDTIAAVLMDLARLETAPRADALADALVAGIAAAEGVLHSRPRLEAGFTVLKAADIPSVLLEVGFLSDSTDLGNILDPAWRERIQQGLRDALLTWAATDAAEADLVRH